MKTLRKKVYVAMSGGVDSSVAAALLKRAGFEVTGVFFMPWSPPSGMNYCNWRDDREMSMRVASVLEIKFKTWDFSRQYNRRVVKYMISSYQNGHTPNPDVMCNKEIKFDLFLKKALAEGADYIATGHYIRKLKNGKVSKLLTAKDPNKDQSYFLWTLTQNQLKYCLFPIGNYLKPEVRKLAKKFNLPNFDKKDSQGVCFIGQFDMKNFLKQYIKPKKGNIILSETGKIIGQHEGVYYYTIGQRHGLNIRDGGGPYFVLSKDVGRNLIYVTRDKKEGLNKNFARVSDVNWIKAEPRMPVKLDVKIRYRNQSIPAILSKNGRDKILIADFSKPATAVTPGQSAVFYYRRNQMLGGGIIIQEASGQE